MRAFFPISETHAAARTWGSGPLSRRAAIAVGLAAVGVGRSHSARAHDDSGTTKAGRWVEAMEIGIGQAEAIGPTAEEPIVFSLPWAATAIAPHWSGGEQPGATIEVVTSPDGERWTDPLIVGEDGDSGRPGRGGRRYGPLIMTVAARHIGYRCFAADGTPATLRGLAWEYLDAASGPNSIDASQEVAATPASDDETVISRAEWGADESLRFQNGSDIWPPVYAPVAHAIVHHSDTANFEDPLVAIRSIYYYHAVTRGWGDIGYNLLVDYRGNIYEGRVGGEGVVGGHAFGYNVGTCGICTIGRFHGAEPTAEMGQGLASATAWVTRWLDPLGEAPFEDIPSLPTICGHRDVNPTSCPGDALYADVGWLRDEVANLAAAKPDAGPPAFQPGDIVATIAAGVTLRDGPSTAALALATMASGERLEVVAGPILGDGLSWYQVVGASLEGWVADPFLTGIDPAATGDPESERSLEMAQSRTLGPGTTAVVTGESLLLHDAPGGEVIGSILEGAWVEVTGPPDDRDGVRWYPVDAGRGIAGWVSGDFLIAR